MKLIYTHENIAIVHSAKNILELNDIDCFVKNEQTHTMGADFGLSNIWLELWLSNDDDYDKALSIVENEISNPVPRPNWICQQCQEENDGSFDLCWKCQGDSGQVKSAGTD